MWHLAALALGATAPFVALTAYLAVALLDHETSAATDQVSKYTQATAADLARMAQGTRQLLAGLAARPAVTALDARACDAILPELLPLNPHYANLFTLDESGRMVCSARPASPAPRVDPRRYLDAARKRRDFVVEKPIQGVVTGRRIVPMVQPILDRERFAGAVVAAVDILGLTELINKQALPQEATISILDTDGLLIAQYPPAQTWAGRDARDAPIVRIALERGSGTARAKGLHNIERLWAFERVPESGWTVLVGRPTSIVLAPVYRAMAAMAGVAVAGIAFVVALCLLLARPIARPIAAIAAAARRMSSGESVERLAPAGPTEVVELSEDLNRMLERRIGAERNLSHSEARLNEAQRHALIGSWRYLPDGRLEWTDQMYELFKLPREAPPTYEAAVAVIHAEDRAPFEERFRHALASGAIEFETEFRVAWPDGQERSMQMTGKIHRDPAGRVIDALGIMQDVTASRRAAAEVREARQRLEGIVASAMDAIVTVDGGQRIVLFNPAAERMFGASAERMIGRGLEELLPPGLRGGHAVHVARFAATGVTSRVMGALGTIFGRRANGDEFPIEAAISQVEVGGKRFFTAILRDITGRVRAEEAVRQANADLERSVSERTAELEAANRELEAFDYSISHDLRAPLTRVRGFSSALAESHAAHLDADGQDLLRRIHAAAEAMDRMVTDMLSLSTLSRGDIRRVEVDLSALARKLLDAFPRSAPGREVEAVVAPGLVASADPGLMRIVLENLLANAWKFTSRTPGARIAFASEVEAGERRFVVRDNGVGFDPAGARRLFEPFRRLHPQADFPGTGIGLATVKRIIERHGGRVWAEAAPGRGAAFYFTLGP